MTGTTAFGILVSLEDMLSGPSNQVVRTLKNIERAANFEKTMQDTGAQTAGLCAVGRYQRPDARGYRVAHGTGCAV